jgi:hypothetical protein
MLRYISFVAILFLSCGLSAQVKDSLPKQRILKQWTLTPDFSEEKSVPLDTAFTLFNRYRIADKFSSVNASLGNYGLPSYQINFFDRITDPEKFLFNTYYPLMHIPENAVFMNTQAPYTEIDWTFGGPRETSEQTFRVRHSQNVNRFLNFGLIYDIVYSLGQYNYQRAEDKTFTFYTSYTGNKYKLYLSAGINNIKSYENGGITDKSQLEILVPRDVEVHLGGLNNALSTFKNRNILLVQRYTFGSGATVKKDSVSPKKESFLGLSGTFSHIFTFETNSRNYDDSYPSSGYYDTVYITNEYTIDSLHSRVIKNTLRFDFTTNETRKFRLGGGVGIRNEISKYYHIVPVPYNYFPSSSVWNKSSNVLIGRLYNNIGDKFRWMARGELYLTGYRAGDFNLNGDITKSFDWKKGMASWLLTGSVANTQPSFWFEEWGGNNFKWNNNFNKEFRIDLGTAFIYPSRKAEIKLNYAIIDNYTDFDTTAMPSQHTGGLSVVALKMKKDIKAWKFHLANDVLVQKSSNINVVDLPLFTLKEALYFEHLFKFASTGGRLYMQVGADATFHTLYHPYSYMPATGRFYRQDKETAGNYPFINLFLNLKLKRTRAFIMFDHVNSGFMGYDYNMVPSYPMNVRMFRYGLAWTFYN